MKKVLIFVLLICGMLALTACGNFTCDHCGAEKSGDKHETENKGIKVTVCDDCYKAIQNAHYYTVEEARNIITSEGYKLGSDIEIKSEDGDFYYKVNLVTEEYEFLTTSGYVEFNAGYEDGEWWTNTYPTYTHDWKLSGSWFAKTENYYVYMDIKDFTNTDLHVIIEGQWDFEGKRHSDGKQEQTISLNECTQNTKFWWEKPVSVDADKVYLFSNKVDAGGYMLFHMRIDKDSMTIWQSGDDYKAEFVPN